MKLLILILLASVAATKPIKVQISVLDDDGFIPTKYTCVGDNVSPEITLKDVPNDAKSLAIIVADPDADKGTVYHWLAWNIPVTDKIAENTAPGTQGKNVKCGNGYTGPCPPSGTHHYHFKVYALDAKLSLPAGASEAALVKAMKGHILAEGELVGLFKK